MRLDEALKGISTVEKGVYNTGFINGEGAEDETQKEAQNRGDLNDLWREFCNENGFKQNSVIYVERV